MLSRPSLTDKAEEIHNSIFMNRIADEPIELLCKPQLNTHQTQNINYVKSNKDGKYLFVNTYSLFISNFYAYIYRINTS